MVQFLGEYPDSEFRAIEVANQHGLVLADAPLQKLWTVHYEKGIEGTVLDADCPYWQIDFRADNDGPRSNIKCFCEF